MQLNKEEIRVLIIEKIVGSIDPSDDLIIEKLIKDDPEVRVTWLAISEEVRKAESCGLSLDVDEQQQWKRLEPLMINQNKLDYSDPGLLSSDSFDQSHSSQDMSSSNSSHLSNLSLDNSSSERPVLSHSSPDDPSKGSFDPSHSSGDHLSRDRFNQSHSSQDHLYSSGSVEGNNYPEFPSQDNSSSNHSFSKVKLLAIKTSVAASVLGIVVVGYFWLSSGHTTKVSPVNTLASSRIKWPTLELPGHPIIELNGNKKAEFRVGDVEFTVEGSSLSYKTKAGNKQDWTLSIPPGSDYKIKLSDGTEIWLNAATTLKFPSNFYSDTRDIYLEGEAFFKVAKNKQLPFIVHTPATRVLVTGTKFNVNTYNINKIQTALVEGSVIVRNENTKEVKLKPGFEAEFTNQKLFETRAFDSLEVLSWMKGIYYFRNIRLQELSEVMRRWYDVDIEFANTALKNKSFSGELRKEQLLQSFLENLNLSGNVEGELRDGKVFFK